MKIHLDYLTNVLLRPLGVTYARSDNPVLDLDQIYLLSDGSDYSSRYIHIGTVSQLPERPPASPSPLLFLCLWDQPPGDAYIEDKNILLLLCPPSVPLPLLCNQANLLFTNVLQSLDELWVFLSKIAATATFTELVGHIGSILGCSVALLSQNFKLLGFFQHERIPASHTWSSTLTRRYFPYTDIITQVRPQGLTVFDASAHRIITEIEDAPESGDAFYPLLSEDSQKTILGFLYFSYSSKGVILSNRSVIQFIAYALSFRMWRYMHSPANSNSSLCFLLRDIISGALIDDVEIGQRLENIRFSPSKTTFLIVIYSSAMGREQKHSWEHLKMVFSQLWPDDVLFTYNGDILMLISSCKSSVLPEEKTTALTAALAEHGCYAGISDCFDVIDRSLRNYYVRTLAAAKMAKNFDMKCRYTFYNDIALQHFVREGSTIENPRNLCDPRILRLASYDHSHASNYIYTLQCYWHFNQDIQQTCTHLFIHRNTLFYRLKKIREIVDMDINNSKHLVQFNLSFAILTALGDIPYSEFPVMTPELPIS